MSIHETIRSGAPLVGTLMKPPHHSVVEALGAPGLDFFILDTEHAPFGVSEIDRSVLAARSTGTPCLVRLVDDRPADILRVLDCGADDFLVPHVATTAQAATIIRIATCGEGGRGYSATNRAGAYGPRSMSGHLKAFATPIIIPQIENPDGAANIEAIADVKAITALFVDPADRAVAHDVLDPQSPRATEAVDEVVSVGRSRGIPVASFAPGTASAVSIFRRGLSIVAGASEHEPKQGFFAPQVIVKTKEEGARPW